jgi:serine/threonine protein kinase
LKKVQVLGTGSFGDVHKANWLGIEVARKTFHGPSAADFEREVEILERLSHPNIVSLLLAWKG